MWLSLYIWSFLGEQNLAWTELAGPHTEPARQQEGRVSIEFRFERFLEIESRLSSLFLEMT